MLSYIRSFAKSPVAVAIFGLLIISFLVFGIGDVFRAQTARDAVVQAGSRVINSQAFKERFDAYRKQVEAQNGNQPITTEQAAQAGLDKGLVDQLASSESFAELFHRIGITPSDKLVVSKIRENQAFFDPVTGKFDRPTYQQRLAQAGMTESQFEGVLRDELAQTHYVAGLAAGLTVPRSYLASLATYAREARDFSWFMLSPGLAGPPAKPTDAELTAYIKANAPTFTKPELRVFTLLRFSPAMIADQIKIDEAAVQKRFDFEKDTLSIPETRSFVQVPVKDAAQAAQVAQRLRAGESPDVVAKSIGVQTVAYVDAPKTAVSDGKIAAAVYVATAPVGAVIGPVQGSVGLQVVKINKVNAGHQATLAEARPKIEAEVRKDAAAEKVYADVQKYDDARSGGANLAEAAKVVGLTPVTTPVGITAQGTNIAGQSLNAPPKLMQSVFALSAGGESEVLDLGNGEYAAVRVDKIMPAGLATLDEVRTAATQRFILEDMGKKLRAKADAVEAQMKKGQSIAQAAASVGAKLETAKAVTRDQAGKAYSADLLNKVFSAKPGEVLVGEGAQLGFIVAKLDQVDPPAIRDLAFLVEGQQQNFRTQVFDDIGFASRNAVRNEIKPKTDYNRARTAIGLEALPASGAAPAGGTPAPATKK